MRDEDKTKEQLINELVQLREKCQYMSSYYKIFEVYFDFSLVSIALLDKDFNFISVNEKYAKADNKDTSYFIGKNHFDLYPSEEALQIFKNVIKKKEPVQILARPFVFPEKNHVVTYWDWTLIPVLNEFEQVETLILCLIDVSEQQQLKNELARLDRLNIVGQMASSLAHEIRNPMTSIKGFLQLLANNEKNLKKCEYYDLIIEELNRANAIITEFLSLARDKRVSKKPASLNALVNSLFPILSSDALRQDKRVILKKSNTPNIPINEKEIRQLILNLVRNGLEAMPSGTELTIGTYTDGGDIVLYVQDEGVGIKPEILEKLGTPFMTTKYNGTGLGLAVCYSIAERHNAKIDVKTGPTGTTFFVRFKTNQIQAEQVS